MREPRAVLEAAEQAAAAGDYVSAERFLREAALLQEVTLGSLHPDLANTLNNLGIVCEITDKPEEAEHFFRRACAIAAAVLEPDHPFVATSRRNLEDFCTARGKALDLPVTSPVIDDLEPPAPEPDDVPLERSSYEDSRPAASGSRSRPLTIGALVAAGLVLVAGARWIRSNGEAESSAVTQSVSRGSQAAAGEAPSVTPTAPDATEDSTAAARPTRRLVSDSPALPPAAAEGRRAAASGPRGPQVAAAELCRDLSRAGAVDWRCLPPGDPVAPGRLFFYTRLKSPTRTTVQHRWYRGDRLRQAVDLTIGANTARGYRTYSRSTVDDQGAGDWKVELRTSDGALLHEERFVVR